MRNDDIFKKLENELSQLELPMSEKLKDTPIETDPLSSQEFAEATAKPSFLEWFINNRKLTTIAACSLATVLIGGVAIASLLPTVSPAPTPTPTPQVGYSSYLYVDINPSIALLFDENEKVKKVLSRNEDGDTLLCDETFVQSLQSSNANEAVTLLAERAAKMGYLDLLANGDNGVYNQINVSVFGENEFPAQTLDTIRSTLTQYFCDNGVLVYVNVTQTLQEDFSQAVELLANRPTDFLDYLSETGNAETTQTALNFFYEFSEDLLTESLEKYDLYTEISNLNSAIEADTGHTYWLTKDHAQAKKMEELLQKFYFLYGEDFQKTGDFLTDFERATSFSLLETVYQTKATDAIELRELLNVGFSEENFTLNELIKFGEFTTTLGYGEDLFTSLFQLFERYNEDATSFISAVKEFSLEYATDLYTRHATYFEAIGSKNSVSQEDYQEFLKKIGKIS